VESEARFRGAFESAGIGMALVSPEGRCLRVNAALCRLFAYPEYRLLQMTFQELTHPDDVDADVALVERTLAGELPGYEMEKRYLDADGREIHAHLTVSLVRDPDGRPLYFISQVQDVTEREETLARLRQALAEVRRLEGLLPICSHCKAIRGEDGRWEPLEAYLDRRSDVSFSHGICPRCERTHFPEP
jgi:PAS domain S-box-containing protein